MFLTNSDQYILTKLWIREQCGRQLPMRETFTYAEACRRSKQNARASRRMWEAWQPCKGVTISNFYICEVTTTLATIIPGGKGQGSLKCDSDQLGRAKEEKSDNKTKATKKWWPWGAPLTMEAKTHIFNSYNTWLFNEGANWRSFNNSVNRSVERILLKKWINCQSNLNFLRYYEGFFDKSASVLRKKLPPSNQP